MEVNLRWMLVLCTISMSFMFPSVVNSDPITIDFNKCQTATYQNANPEAPLGPVMSFSCCPIKPTLPPIEGIPEIPNTLRVRKAAQCNDEEYAAKLNKAYALMRALPDDDPRSHTQQYLLHCAYCGGAFLVTNSSGVSEGIDIHFSWFFFPWHRYFLFFHERILQSLLGDPTFSLTYWNWDSPYTVGDGSSKKGRCLKAGDDFPWLFANPSTAQYDGNRSAAAKGQSGLLHFPDFASFERPQSVDNTSTEQQVIASNMNVMYKAMVSSGSTTESFMARPYRVGDLRGVDKYSRSGKAAIVQEEVVDLWKQVPMVVFTTGLVNIIKNSFKETEAPMDHEVGQKAPMDLHNLDGPPENFRSGAQQEEGAAGEGGLDMGPLVVSARDPIFFAHHSNVDRLWQVWKDIGPLFGQNRQYYSDPDFLNASFLFYDEKKVLRRVYVRDSLETTNFGYVYEQTTDAAWLFLNSTRCSKSSDIETLAQAESLPVLVKDDSGYYHLQAGKPFIIVIDRPDNYGLEEFLTIDGIKLDRSTNAGFDVFVDLLYPNNFTAPCRCAEYIGRFMNMATNRYPVQGRDTLIWKQSITRTLVDIQAPLPPSKLVITLSPLYQVGDTGTIKFTSIAISTD